jgi:hypothetical protein
VNKSFGRPRRIGERCTELVQVPVPPSLRRQLEQEAAHAGYQSLAGYVRERKLRPLGDLPPAA